MSEQPTAPAPRGGNVFTRKLGPLPMWVWMLIVLVVAVGYYLLRKNAGGSAQSQANAQQAAGNTPGGVDASLVPQFVNQTYTNVQPPASPNVTVNNNEGSTTTTPPPGPSTLQETFSKGHIINPNHNKATVGWSTANVGAQGASQLKVQLNGPGQNNIHPTTRYVPASATSATFESLLPNHNYQVWVTPVDAHGKVVGQTAQIDLKTKLWQT